MHIQNLKFYGKIKRYSVRVTNYFKYINFQIFELRKLNN